jgi:hypoxanthine-guanine phosphoribosyltransferase
MSNGFNDDKLKVVIKQNEVDKLLKQYKKVKKYMKSPLYAVKVMDGTETYVSQLIKEAEENG